MKHLFIVLIILGLSGISYASIADEIFKAALNYGVDSAKNQAIKKGIEIASQKVGLKGGYTLAKGYFVWKQGKPDLAKGVVKSFWLANKDKKDVITKVCSLNDKILKYTSLGNRELPKFMSFVLANNPKTTKYLGQKYNYKRK